MKITVLVFSTKSVDKPKSFCNAEEDLTVYPPMIHFAAELVEMDLEDLSGIPKVLYTISLPIKPIRNNISIDLKDKELFDELLVDGEEMFTVSMLFQGLLSVSNVVVCHNWQLDRNIIVSELLRFGIKPSFKVGTKTLCTMKYSTDIIKLPGSTGGKYKWPTLNELLMELTGKKFKEYYPEDTLGNVEATKDCFIALARINEKLQQWLKGEINSIY